MDGSCLDQLLKAQTLPTINVSDAAQLFGNLNLNPEWERTLMKRMISGDVEAMTEEERRLNDFMFVACVKDCSFIITFGRVYGGDISSKIKLIDLDPKPVSRIPHYVKLDENIRFF